MVHSLRQFGRLLPHHVIAVKNVTKILTMKFWPKRGASKIEKQTPFGLNSLARFTDSGLSTI
jgi:hypothetical protein